MRSIAIVLNDHDFDCTVRNLLASIREALMWSEKGLTQEMVTALIGEGIRYHYMAFQVSGHQDYRAEASEIKATVAYLQKNLKVLFDDEADADMLHEKRNGGAWHLLIADNQINAY